VLSLKKFQENTQLSLADLIHSRGTDRFAEPPRIEAIESNHFPDLRGAVIPGALSDH